MSDEKQIQTKEEIPMISIKIDGKSFSVPKMTPNPITGKPEPTTIIRACSMVGVKIPHFCFHPRLPVSGNCRMCLVEYGVPAVDRATRKPILNPDGTQQIRKMPRPTISCATPISPGMEIYTNTENVKRYREAVLEFLLINHPLDCSICDQAGDCKLQEFAHQYGQETSRFVEIKNEKMKHRAISSKIVLDNERCILCTRCVRFTREVVGIPSLGVLGRGGKNYISPFPGTDFEHNYTLNVVDLCPVGALTSRDFRFRMRSWFLAETKSICPGCATGCNIFIHSREKQIYRLKPRDNDAVNAAWMCDMGRLNYKWIQDPRRLTNVIRERKEGGRFETTWDDAIGKISYNLKNSPKGTTAILVSARLSTEEIYLVHEIAKQLGAITDSMPRTGEGDTFLLNKDLNPNSKAIQIFGLAGTPPGSNVASIAQKITSGEIRNLLALGENPEAMGIPRSLLGRLDLFVVCDVLGNKSTLDAQVLLPGASFAEKQGTFINAKGRVQRFGKAFDPLGNAKPEHWIFSRILSKMTDQAWPEEAADIFNKMATEVPAFQGLTWEKLGSTGMNLSTTNSTEK